MPLGDLVVIAGQGFSVLLRPQYGKQSTVPELH